MVDLGHNCELGRNYGNFKVGIICTYPPLRCGMAKYVYDLSEALARFGINVVVFANEEARSVGSVKVLNAWRYNKVFSAIRVFLEVLKEKIDIAQFHHEYLLYGSPIKCALFTILLSFLLKIANKRLIVMLHSVIPRSAITKDFTAKYGLSKVPTFIISSAVTFLTKFICFMAYKIIVYTDLAKYELCNSYGIPKEKVIVIPHGTPEAVIVEKAKEKLGLSGKKVLTFFGFLRPQKGLEPLAEATLHAKTTIPNLVLLVVGGRHARLPYVNSILDRYSRHFIILTGYVPEEDLPLYFSATDAFIFPYEDNILSASGAMYRVLGYGKPIIVTNAPKFYECKKFNAGLIVPLGDLNALVNAIISALKDDNSTHPIRRNILRFYRKRRWSRITMKFIKLYKCLLVERMML
jgi:glycosyltransferase involved in cell wall biosynthesis